MIILNATNKSLELVLAAAVATTQPDFVASYVDLTTTTFTSAEQDGVGNGVTAVTVVSAPAALTQRQVKFLTVLNRDTAAITATIRYNNNGTIRQIVKVTLAIGSTLVYTDGEGWRVIDALGQIQVASSQAGSGLQMRTVTFTDAQIKALPTTSLEVIPAPGPGLWVDIAWSLWILKATAGAYTNFAAAPYAVLGTAGEADTMSAYLFNAGGFNPFTDFFTTANERYTHVLPYNKTGAGEFQAPGSGDLSSVVLVNAPIYFILNNGASGNLTGGNAANTLRVTTYYTVQST